MSDYQTVKDIQEKAQSVFNRYKQQWLRQTLSYETPELPDRYKSIKLQSLTGTTVLRIFNSSTAFEDYCRWKEEWAEDAFPNSCAGRVEWAEKRFQSTRYADRLPVCILFDDVNQIIKRGGKAVEQEWQELNSRCSRILEVFPGIDPLFLPENWDLLTKYSEHDFQAFLNLVHWLLKNPGSNLYIRQIPVTGIHTKWLTKSIQQHVLNFVKGIVEDFELSKRFGIGLSGSEIEEKISTLGVPGAFCSVFGLIEKPNMIRIRLLDPKMQQQFGGLEDLTVPRPQAAKMSIQPKMVIFSENEQTGLAFPMLPETVLIFSLGNNIGSLDHIPWLKKARILYWGDIDTHGYKILNSVRRVLPQTESMAMDRVTFESFPELRSTEDHPFTGELTYLTKEERYVYEGLRDNLWGLHLRLEQERLSWPIALKKIRSAVAI